jgi:hypothetical protein
MIKEEQLARIKQIITEQKEKETNGQAQAERLELAITKLTNLINSTESYLRTESSKTYDDESYKNHLRGEVSGYKIALDLIKAAK